MNLNKTLLAGLLLAGSIAPAWAQLNLGLDITNSSETGVALTSGTSITVQPGGVPSIGAMTDREIVCLDQTGAAAGEYELNLVDPNNQNVFSNNVVGATFNPATLLLTLGSTTQCFTLADIADQPLDPQAPDLCGNSGGGEFIFVQGGFEEPRAELAAGISIVQAPTVVNDPIQYEVVVQNCSTLAAATNVRVRDFFYAEPTAEAARFEYSASGSWKPCAFDGPCAPSATPGYADHVFASIPAGGQVSLSAERFLDPTATPAGNVDTAKIGAFVSDGSETASTRVDVVVVENEPPQITTTQGDVTVDEDSTTLTLADVDATDSDGSVTALQVSSTDTDLISVVSPAPTLNGDGSASLTGATITPVADAFGSATLTIAATDNEGAMSTQDITVTISAQNDAPTFSALAADDTTLCAAEGGAFVDGTGQPGCADREFPDTTGGTTVFDFIQAVTVGPANEAAAGQTIANVGVISFGAGLSSASINQVNLAEGPRYDLALSFASSGASDITVQVEDSLGGMTTATFTVTRL